jgi:hypothetical protein
MLDSIDEFPPARDLTRRRRKYFIGTLDPCASVEFTRGCPWDCSFCSACTFYGRSWRKASPQAAAAEVAAIREPGVFIVDNEPNAMPVPVLVHGLLTPRAGWSPGGFRCVGGAGALADATTARCGMQCDQGPEPELVHVTHLSPAEPPGPISEKSLAKLSIRDYNI